MTLTREQLLARKVGRAEPLDLPEGGGTVMVRGLTRAEALEMNDLKTVEERDNFIIATGLVEPKLSVEEVREWAAEASAGDTTAISMRIAELSGMAEGAGKSGVARARRKPGS